VSFLAELANKIEVHIKLDASQGYYLSQEDQEAIVWALRIADKLEKEDARDPAIQPIRTDR
jgi:hypothetical protein